MASTSELGAVSRIDRADVRHRTLPSLRGAGGCRARHLGGVETVGYKLEFFVRLLRIARVNLFRAASVTATTVSRVGNSFSFDAPGRLFRARTVAEGEADEFEGRCNPFITEIGNDGQIWKLLTEFLDQQEIGEGRYRDRERDRSCVRG